MKRKLFNLILFLLLTTCTFFTSSSQNSTVSYLVELNTGVSTKNNVPFWMVSNKYGSIPNNNYGTVYASLFSDFKKETSAFDFSYKASFTGLQEAKNNLIVNELYVSTRYKNLQLDLGVKNPDILFEGLSSSNGNISRSTNARSFPGYNLSIPNFIELPFAKNWLAIKGNYSDYFLNDKRVVSDIRLHAKSLVFKSKLASNIELITGIYHYVQWGGNSPEFGKQPSGFKDYLKIVGGKAGGSGARIGDRINALGNHLGSYLLELKHNGEKNNWSFYYSHPFEDTSGMEMQNWKDGIYGVFIDFKKQKSLITHLLGEFTYTKNMSGNSEHYIDEAGGIHVARGRDNYFNHGTYVSGWTYFGNTIGSPYFSVNTDEDGITNGVKVGYNRFMAFNFGMKGFLHHIPYKALLSHVTYYGYFNSEFEPKPQQFSGYLEITIPTIEKLPFNISIGTAFDTGTYNPVNFGGFIKLSKRGVF